MKRLPLLLFFLAPAALTGCQTIQSHNPFRHKEPAYKAAQQEQPLEVPPGMSPPPTSEALAIPNAGAGTASATPGAMAPAEPPQGVAPPPAGDAAGNAGSLTLGDTPDSAYHRVGLALERGDVGKVTSHDDTAHSYQVAVDTGVTQKPEGGFLHRMFHRSKSESVTGNVTVSVAPQGSGSVVEVSGNPDAAARVMALLQQRLQ